MKYKAGAYDLEQLSLKLDSDQKVQLSCVSLEVTDRCNQKCMYCYNQHRGVTGKERLDEPTRAILELVDLIAYQQPIRQITLTGGEPFLRSDILTIIDHISSKGLNIGIVSNAIAVDGKLAAELSKREVSYVQVTFLGPDGPSHDRIAGHGSFSSRYEGVRNLVSSGIAVGGAFICTKLNYRLVGQTLARMSDWGIREHLCFMRFCSAGYSTLNSEILAPSLEEVLEALEQANRFGESHHFEIHNKIPIPPCVVNEDDYPNIVFSFCGAGVDGGECFVDQRGDVRLCGPNPIILGNIRETPLKVLLDSKAVQNWKEMLAPACAPCELRSSCRGGCPVAESDPLKKEIWVSWSHRYKLEPLIDD